MSGTFIDTYVIILLETVPDTFDWTSNEQNLDVLRAWEKLFEKGRGIKVRGTFNDTLRDHLAGNGS